MSVKHLPKCKRCGTRLMAGRGINPETGSEISLEDPVKGMDPANAIQHTLERCNAIRVEKNRRSAMSRNTRARRKADRLEQAGQQALFKG